MPTTNSAWLKPQVVPGASAVLLRAKALGLFLTMAACLLTAAAPPPGTHDRYVEGEVLVRFRTNGAPAAALQGAARHGLTWKQHFGRLSAREGRMVGVLRSPTQTTEAMLTKLRADPAIEHAAPNYLHEPAGMRPPTDTKFSQLWGLQNTGQTIGGITGSAQADISFLKAWGLGRNTTNEIVIAVMDTGMDITHPDLAGNLWTNPGEIPGNGVDDDGNGYVDDVHGYDFSLATGSMTDSAEHGTHVAGTIAACGNNNIGVIGVDFLAHLMALKISASGTNMSTSAIIEGIEYAIAMKQRGVNIVAINASFGGGDGDDLERAAIQAAGEAGIIFCAAAGNNGTNNNSTPFYPASFRLTNMVVVAASDQRDSLATFSNYGSATVDLAAPGVNILSCIPTNFVAPISYVKLPTNTIAAQEMVFSPLTSSNGVAGAIYACGLGNPEDFPAAVRSNIALIERGTLYFWEKVSNAMAAGASAAIVFNNVTGGFSGTLSMPGNPAWIPTICISQEDGQILRGKLPITGAVVNMPSYPLYQVEDGTSMAAPHVSGAIAFAARNFPEETMAQRIRRILENTTKLPALAGKTITGGRLNLARIVDTDGNELADWWERQYFNQLTGTSATADSDNDGANNLAEFLAGTDPKVAGSNLRLTLRPAAKAAALQWFSAEGRHYRLLSSTNLATGFTVLSTNISATPPLNSLTNLPASGAQTYYRLQLEP